jgi:hypothetical protein
MYPHRIRLHGPWEVEPVARIVRRADGTVQILDEPVPAGMRMTIPCRWHEGGLGEFAGRVRFRRRFGYPGRIDPYERVWLTFEGVAGSSEICLNGTLLGHRSEAECPFEFEITDLLQGRNELAVQIDAPEGRGGLWGEVALEVRCTAFLRAVQAWGWFEDEIETLQVSGEVVGTSGRPLELYVLVDGATQHYAVVDPTPEGRTFQVKVCCPTSEKPRADVPAGKHVVRVDLVSGAMLWYVVERLITIEAAPDRC